MEPLQREMRALARLRLALFASLLGSLLGGSCLLALVPSYGSWLPEARVTFLIALAAFSLLVIRVVANALETVETPCPRCARAFFGGIAGVARVLPLPPAACVHCAFALGDREGWVSWARRRTRESRGA